MKEIRFQDWVLVFPKTVYGRRTLVVKINEHDLRMMKEQFGEMVQFSGTTFGIMENETTIKTYETATWRGKQKIDGIWRKQ